MSEIINIRVKHRRMTAQEWSGSQDILLEGEIGVELDTGQIKVGDGNKVYSELPYTGTADDLDNIYAKINHTHDDYATKKEVTSVQSLVQSNTDKMDSFALKTELPKNYLTSIPSNVVTDEKLASSGYAKKTDIPRETFTQVEADELYQEKGDYATRSELENAKLSGTDQAVDLTGYVTQRELDAKNYINSSALTKYVTEDELNERSYITLADVPRETFTQSDADNLYQPKGNYASTSHNHDGRYITNIQLEERIQSYDNENGYLKKSEFNSTIGDIESVLSSVVGVI